ncbi:MAG: DinB family protein [Anaerolineales bacterium]|nr:DinB family protein [Anaerolineales bacterium]
MRESKKELLTVGTIQAGEPEIGSFLWLLEAARRQLKRTLNEIDEQWLDWEPPYNGNSIGTLLYHIAAIEIDWLYEEVLQTKFPAEITALLPFAVRDETGRLTAVRHIPLSDHIQRLDDARTRLLDVYADMSLAEFRRVRHLSNYDVTPEWVLHHLIQHETEHRGQIMEIHQQILAAT